MRADPGSGDGKAFDVTAGGKKYVAEFGISGEWSGIAGYIFSDPQNGARVNLYSPPSLSSCVIASIA